MVQYKLIIKPDNSYKKHGNHPYWEIKPHLHVPPEWKDVPTCIQEEWLQKIPNPFRMAEIGGTKYTLMDDLLLPLGQLPHYILTENDILIQERLPRRPAEPDFDFLPPYRPGRQRRRRNQLDLPLR